MAGDASKNKAKFPVKFRGLVNDVKGFTRDIYHHRRGTKSEHVLENQTWVTETPTTSEAPESPKTTEVTEFSEEKPLFRDAPRNASLTVQVTLNFDEPLNYSYSRNYEASPSLHPTDELCEGLLRRIDHCSQELITRKDSSALERTSTDGSAKPLRFEIHVQIVRARSEIWTSRTFRSYQRLPLGAEAAKEIILSAHRMVGLFLRHHDEGFVWKDGPVHDDLSQEHETFPYRPGRVQQISCIPRAYFLEKSQNFESIPGYTITLSVTSRNHRRKPSEWTETVEINSSQTTPLGLASAESLFFDASYAVESVFRLERKGFEDRHRPCSVSDGCKHCRPHEGDGLELKLTVANNLGPHFDHLERTILAETNFFSHPKAADCAGFVKSLEAACVEVRDAADDAVSRIDDLEFKITELRSRGWALDQPLVFTLDSTNCYSRRTVEAILDRIQTGVADILRGNAIAVRMTAHKRGHFILDKTLVARDPFEQAERKKSKPVQKSKEYIIHRLQQRIERDIQMICKDTCSISDLRGEKDDVQVAAATLQNTSSARASDNPLPHDKPDSDRSLPQEPVIQSEDFAASVPQNLPTITVSVTNPQGEVGGPEENANDSEDSEYEDSSTETASQNGGVDMSSSTSSPTSQQQTTVITDSRTGARKSPLISECDDRIELDSYNTKNVSCDTNVKRRLFGVPSSENRRDGGSLPRRASSLSTGIEAKRTEGEDQVSTADNLDAKSDLAYESSIAPETPSLVGGGGSPRSSLLITPPKTHEPVSSHEVDLFTSSAIDSGVDDGKVLEKSGEDTPRNLFSDLPIVLPPSGLLPSQKIARSPLHRDYVVQEDSGLGISETSDFADVAEHGDEQGNIPTMVVEPEQASASIAGKQLIDLKPAIHENPQGSETDTTRKNGQDIQQDLPEEKPTDKIVASTNLEPLATSVPNVELPESEGAEFSQSKLDFEFSSPGAVTPSEGGISPLEDHERFLITTDKNITDATVPATTSQETPDPSEDVDFAPLLPRSSSQTRTAERQLSHRFSFGGSAGHIGLHEHQFGGLRKALFSPAHRPASRSSSTCENDHDELATRSATPPTPLLRSVTPEAPEAEELQ
ncbi:hypothetical protein F5X99DRAFT_189627 [Biscogniauxia marginata]|nr:hypothetical protein F5X99DRAFT_189627 [Biscogniauxia marginata]